MLFQFVAELKPRHDWRSRTNSRFVGLRALRPSTHGSFCRDGGRHDVMSRGTTPPGAALATPPHRSQPKAKRCGSRPCATSRSRRPRTADRRDAAAVQRAGAVAGERGATTSTRSVPTPNTSTSSAICASASSCRRAHAHRGRHGGRDRGHDRGRARRAAHADRGAARRRAAVPAAEPLLPVRQDGGRAPASIVAGVAPGYAQVEAIRAWIHDNLDLPLRRQRRRHRRARHARQRRRRLPRLLARRHRAVPRAADPGAHGGRLPAPARSDGHARLVRGLRRRPLVHLRRDPGPPRGGRIVVAYGRDAADVAFLSNYGPS